MLFIYFLHRQTACLFLFWGSANANAPRGGDSTGRGKGLDMSLDSEAQPVTMSTAEAGHIGGSTVRDKYGEDYFRRIGKKGGTSLKEKRGSEYYRTIAQKGGQANVDKYGPDHFSSMGKKGGNTTKERQDADFYSRIGRMGGTAKRQKSKE